jgi:hypothetical protein
VAGVRPRTETDRHGWHPRFVAGCCRADFGSSSVPLGMSGRTRPRSRRPRPRCGPDKGYIITSGQGFRCAGAAASPIFLSATPRAPPGGQPTSATRPAPHDRCQPTSASRPVPDNLRQDARRQATRRPAFVAAAQQPRAATRAAAAAVRSDTPGLARV